MEFEKDNINVNNYPTLSKSEVKNVLLRCQQLLKTSNKFQNAVLSLSESWQEFIEDLDKLFNLKEMYFISNILNSNKDVQYIISENKFYSQKLREMNDFISKEFILPIKGKTDELQKKVSNKKVEKALKHESKSRKKENFENPNSNTKSLVQKSIFNNNYEIFQCVVNSSNKLINHVDHLFSKPQVHNLTKHDNSINKSRHKKSYSNASPSDLKALYNNNNNMNTNKTYNNNNYNLNSYQNSKLSKHSSIIDNTEHANIEKNFTAIPNYDEQGINSNTDTRDKNGPISPLNNELHLDFGVSEIKNQNVVITNSDLDNNDDEIITSPTTITNLNNELAQMNDAYKFMKKQQRIACHNRSHSVGADPFNNNSIVTQEKYLSLINGSAMPNNLSSLTMDSPFNQPSSTTNIDTSSKIPSLTSIIDTPSVSGSTPSLEITQSKIQPPTNSHILNMLSMTNNSNNKRFSNSYLSSSNLNNASSLNISEIENPYNKVISDDSFCENQSFSISQSTIIKDNRRKSIDNDSIFDNDISFDNGEEEVIHIDDDKENLMIKSENVGDIDINDMNLNDNNKPDENEIIYIKENEGEQITKIEVVEIIENEIISQNIENTTEVDNINDIENELESEIINEIDLPSAVETEEEEVLTPKVKEKEMLDAQVVQEEFVEKGSKSDRIPVLQTEEELVSSRKSKSQQDDPKSLNIVKTPENLNIEINPTELNKLDLNIDSAKSNEKNFVKRSKSINIFKSHERSRSLTDMRFDKKHILSIIFNKKDSSISRRNSGSSIKRSNSNSNTDNKSIHSSPSRKSASGSLKESFKSPINLPEFNCNKFLKSNSPFVDSKLQRRHSISNPEKTNLDYTVYNKDEKKENAKTATIPRSYKRKDMETQYIHNELKRTPIPIEKDNERISIGEIQSSLFNISSLSGSSLKEENEKDHSSRSQSSRYSSTSSQLRKERLRLGKQYSPTKFRRNNSITKPISPNNYKNTQIETEKPQLNHPITTTPILENAMNDILNKELSDITVTDKAHSFEKHTLENQDKIPMENLSIYNSSDIKNIPNYTDSKVHRKNKEDNNYSNKDSLDEEDDNSNGSIMALINKNWKLLNDDYSENENVMTPTPLSQKSDNNNKFIPSSNEFVTIENDNFINNNNTNNYLNNSEYIKCMNNLGNPFLNPNNALEISENEAYKGKAVICSSPSIEVESIIGSILYVNDTEEDAVTTEKFEYDDDDAFDQDLQKHTIYPDDKINEDKENMNYNNMNNPLSNNNINNEKDVKSNNIISNVTSFRKFSLPTSNMNKSTNSEKKYLQRSQNGGKYPYADNLSPLSNIRNINSENNSSSAMGTSTTVSSKHKNKKYERIIAVHDYKGRDRRELSMEKGDVLIVKQKKGTWIYGIKESNIFKIDLITNQKIKFEHREHGWVPISYVKPYNKK